MRFNDHFFFISMWFPPLLCSWTHWYGNIFGLIFILISFSSLSLFFRCVLFVCLPIIFHRTIMSKACIPHTDSYTPNNNNDNDWLDLILLLLRNTYLPSSDVHLRINGFVCTCERTHVCTCDGAMVSISINECMGNEMWVWACVFVCTMYIKNFGKQFQLNNEKAFNRALYIYISNKANGTIFKSENQRNNVKFEHI